MASLGSVRDLPPRDLGKLLCLDHLHVQRDFPVLTRQRPHDKLHVGQNVFSPPPPVVDGLHRVFRPLGVEIREQIHLICVEGRRTALLRSRNGCKDRLQAENQARADRRGLPSSERPPCLKVSHVRVLPFSSEMSESRESGKRRTIILNLLWPARAIQLINLLHEDQRHEEAHTPPARTLHCSRSRRPRHNPRAGGFRLGAGRPARRGRRGIRRRSMCFAISSGSWAAGSSPMKPRRATCGPRPMGASGSRSSTQARRGCTAICR